MNGGVSLSFAQSLVFKDYLSTGTSLFLEEFSSNIELQTGVRKEKVILLGFCGTKILAHTEAKYVCKWQMPSQTYLFDTRVGWSDFGIQACVSCLGCRFSFYRDISCQIIRGCFQVPQ